MSYLKHNQLFVNINLTGFYSLFNVLACLSKVNVEHKSNFIGKNNFWEATKIIAQNSQKIFRVFMLITWKRDLKSNRKSLGR